MIKIGLIGEDPNDTSSIKNLLQRKYPKVQFLPLAKGVKGHQLDSAKIKNLLPIEFADKKCHFVIFVRDLDAFETEKARLKEKRRWFQDLDDVINGKGLLLLNIWELEALLLADIEKFNIAYDTEIKFPGDPMRQKDPKRFLKSKTFNSQKQYHESHCPQLFKVLDIGLLEKRCWYFKNFIAEFEKILAA